ncbi:Teichuronic acid biosynthesis protein TuaB [Pseudoalteromonas sp. P1-13-1a]|uniref:Oligosaccharide flippase family protein n=1 Tax=Pseudoalteromonas undina TaxID=43660 RepID=A0ACC6R1R0_9GAMM|nr:oligosaccharide flippase family protein [Pseudoalteromonas sp. P1-13-1a]KPZ52520.1 Teichuronic acid biosynthesis protein TuaB [Pseudoalteromonas sp. P1-13-1a]MDC9521288.1 oligosaccharide flippase family protein [Pseudoalteromonas sp. Angola-31]
MSNKKQGAWLFVSAGVAGGVQFLIFSMLAYYTSPESIGVLAIVNVFLAIAFLVQDMGLSNYFIYKQNLTRAQSSTLYYTNCVLGLIASLIITVLAAPVERFYDSNDIGQSMYIMAFNFILLGFSAQYQANFIKSEQNVTLAKIDIAIKISLLISTFTLIQLGISSIFPYLYSYLITNFIRYLVFVFIADKTWHPTLKVDLKIIKPAIAFGSYQMGSQVISQVRTQLDQLIIGKIMGVEILGLYSFAKELIMQPVKFIRTLIARMLYPKLARLQDNQREFYKVLNGSAKTLLLLNSTLYFLYVTGLLVLVHFFFHEYEKSLPVLCILLILGLVAPFGSLFGVIAQAKGNTKIEFNWSMISAVISVISLFFIAQVGNINLFSLGVAGLQISLTIGAFFYFGRYNQSISKKSFFLMLSANLGLYAAVYLLYALL